MWSRLAPLALLLWLGSACGPPADPVRAVATRFAQAFDPRAEARPDAYLAADAEVFLQGAPVALTRDGFRQHLAVLQRSQRAYTPTSRVYRTAAGAGWLTAISVVTDGQFIDDTPSDASAQLWLEVRVERDLVRQAWFHFTAEGLARLRIAPETYVATAERAGRPVPSGWRDGTLAMLEDAEGFDARR